MALLTKQQIKDAPDLRTEDIKCPEWGGTVRVRNLTGREHDYWEECVTVQKGERSRINFDSLRPKLVRLGAIGDDGKQLFDDVDVRMLAEKSSLPVSRLFNAISRLSGISKEDVDEMEKSMPHSEENK